MRQWGVLVLLLLAAGPSAARDFWEEPAFADRPLRGPAAARGVIVYNHGNHDVKEESRAPVQPLMRLLAEDGWDVVKFSRRRVADDVRAAEDALVGEIAALRRRGYATIILAGPSRGGWLALMAATRVPVFAVIATAPGGFGTRGDGIARSFAELRARLPQIQAQRVVVVDMAGDPRVDRVGGRGGAFRTALTNVPAWVIDRPPGFTGHTAAMTGRFARIYGACIRRFLAMAQPECDTGSGPAAGDDLPLPADARAVPPRGLLGRWVGIHRNGDARVLVVTALGAGKAQAVWAWGAGPIARRERRPGFERLACRLTGDTLTCPRKAGLAVFRRDGTGLDYAWIPAKRGQPRLAMALRRPGHW
jgi:hypothetical protein